MAVGRSPAAISCSWQLQPECHTRVRVPTGKLEALPADSDSKQLLGGGGRSACHLIYRNLIYFCHTLGHIGEI